MSRESLLVFAGVLILLGQFIGLPLSWLAFLFPVLGILVVSIGFSYARERKRAPVPAHEAYPPDSA